MSSNHREDWLSHDGRVMSVIILRRYLTTEDVCPECAGGLRIAVGKHTESGEQVYRLECVSCAWTTEALPDPEA